MGQFRQISTFVEVVAKGSLSAAARAEGIAPAMIGRRLDALEQRLGVKLLQRTTRKLALTNEGAAFLEDCQRILNIFPTASGRRKARIILHGICAFACRRGWAGKNPAAETPCPHVKERRVPVLTPEECRRLMTAAQEVCGGECLPAAVLMLYAGVRPQEVRRLQFRHIRLEEKAALIPARHSKTGGARRVTLRPAALRYLRAFRHHSGEEPLCPAGWERKWRLVRARAGWNNSRPWVQDVLRHTFASYHALEFRDYAELQWEMGHQNAHLLKTRYLNMDEIRRQDARAFWLAA